MCALHIRSDGTEVEVKPANGSHFQLEELYDLLNCHVIEVGVTKDSKRLIVMDEEGRLRCKPKNAVATSLYRFGHARPIVGDVLVCDPKEVR